MFLMTQTQCSTLLLHLEEALSNRPWQLLGASTKQSPRLWSLTHHFERCILLEELSLFERCVLLEELSLLSLLDLSDTLRWALNFTIPPLRLTRCSNASKLEQGLKPLWHCLRELA